MVLNIVITCKLMQKGLDVTLVRYLRRRHLLFAISFALIGINASLAIAIMSMSASKIANMLSLSHSLS